MESHGVAGCIQVTARTYERLRDGFRFERRGPIQVKGKGKGEMVTYFLVARKAMIRPIACHQRATPFMWRHSTTEG
jgi:class 3 adenylate cyclase